MSREEPASIAILYPGDGEARRASTLQTSRFLPVSKALEALGAQAVSAVYNDDFARDVKAQLLQVDAVLVWVNPIENGHDRTMLDQMLREVSAAGVYVSAHPDVIDVLGTKEVLYRTRAMGWGASDSKIHRSGKQLQEALLSQLNEGKTRVLKKARGNGGNAVWKVEPVGNVISADSKVRVLYAKRGSAAECISVSELAGRFEQYFADGGVVIDQAYQARLPEGMVRCYLVQDKVAGFGHQAVNALCPPIDGAPSDAAPDPTPRLYYPASLSRFQAIRTKMETDWLPELKQTLDIESKRLPIIWDCDFLLGAKDENGDDTYVLCEINASCVAPFPDSAIDEIAQATIQRALEARLKRRGGGNGR